MNKPPLSKLSDLSSSDAFYDLVERLVDIVNENSENSLDTFLNQHPEHVDRLLEVVPALQALADFSESGASVPPASDEMSSRLGQLGDFQILREIGRGGMGVVYEARQITLNRRVAVKILPFAGALDPRRQQRFQNEAMAAAQLRHPSIVGVHFVGCERGVHFYAMEFIEGHSLAELLVELRQKASGQTPDEAGMSEGPTDSPLPPSALSGPKSQKKGTLNEGESRCQMSTVEAQGLDTRRMQDSKIKSDYYRQVARWGQRIADALEYAHSVGVIHRDIKPSNILLDGTKQIFVADFGLAQVGKGEAGLTLTGDFLGTIRYMSPEQAQGKQRLVDHRSDLYSLGITLYELLTLRPAFPGDDRVQLLHDVTHVEPKTPRQIAPEIPQDLETIVLKAIRKEPGERYGSLQELSDELSRFIKQEPIRARPPSRADRLAKWSRRHRGMVLVGSLLSVLLTIVIAIASVLVIQERGRRIQEAQARKYDAALAQTTLTEERAKRLEEEHARKISDVLARQGAETKRQHQYVSNIQLAWQAWNRSRLADMSRHLKDCSPKEGETDLRGWEWRYLWKLLQAEPEALGEHDGQAFSMGFSPDESILATCGEDGVRLWDTQTLQQLRHLSVHKLDVNTVGFSPDRQFLATASDDGTVKIWETENWTVAHTMQFKSYVLAGFSPDGRRLIAIERGREKHQNRINIYATKTWKLERTWQPDQTMIQAVDMTPDSRFLVTTASDKTCVLWDCHRPPQEPPKVVATRVTGDAYSAVFLPGGDYVAIGTTDGTIHIWDHRQNTIVRTIHTVYSTFEALTISSDKKYLVAASRSGVAILWKINLHFGIDEKPRSTVKAYHALWCARIDSQGFLFTADTEGHIQRTLLGPNPETPLTIPSVERGCYHATILFLGEGERFVRGMCGVHVFDTATGQVVKTLLPYDGSATNIALSQDQSQLAVMTANGDIHLWNADSLEKQGTWSIDKRWAIENPVSIGYSLVFLPDASELIAMFAKENAVRINVETGHNEPFADVPIHRIYWSPDGRYQLQLTDNRPHQNLIERDTKQPVSIKLPGKDLPGFISHAAWSPDGKHLAILTWSGTIYFWETETWEQTARFNAAPNGARSFTFSPDGRTFAVGDGLGEIILWNTVTQRILFQLNVPASKLSSTVRFSPNGQTLATTGSRDDKGHIWLWNALLPDQE